MAVPERNGILFQNGISTEEAQHSCRVFNDLVLNYARRIACLYHGMNFWLILFAAQVAVTVFAALRKKKGDTAFEGDKLDYRS